MNRRSAFLWLLIASVSPAAETGFLNRSVAVDGVDHRYVVYVPRDFNAATQWPMILFLHGSGESGTDGLLQTELGLPRAIRRHQERFPAIVVMPQVDHGKWWSDSGMEKHALAALDASAREFHGDPDRIYLTGLSLGGYGTWSIAANNPGKFAALVPICGGIVRPVRGSQSAPEVASADPYAEAAKKIGSTTPIWMFHGDADESVPVTESRKLMEALQKIAANVRYTEYPGVQHNSWDLAYNNPEFPTWLFAQRLRKK
jgi:predicted peptidase